MGATTSPLLRVEGVTKTFGRQVALDDVDLDVRAGEVVALLGQNGSGKSTLVKILAGLYAADAGSVSLLSGEDGGEGSRIRFIHQDLGLIDQLSTVENLSLASAEQVRAIAPLRLRDERVRAVQAMQSLGVRIDVTLPVGKLTPAEKTMVAIARALDGWQPGGHLLVLDEPTAALHGGEAVVLFDAIRRLATAGAGVLFISHRLEEVEQLADRVVVLRDGRVVANRAQEGLDVEDLAELITGHRVGRGARRGGTHDADTDGPPELLVATGLSGGTLKHLDLSLRPGEIVGIGGGLGSGREVVASLLYGAVPFSSGSVKVAGSSGYFPSPRAALAMGVAFVPADRKAHGAVMSHTVAENVALPRLREFFQWGIHLVRKREQRAAQMVISQVDLRPRRTDLPMDTLSGGNQQKVVVGRWLRLAPRVLLVEEPTQGVDVAAADSIRSLLQDAAREGAAVLIASSDNADLTSICHRVIVLRDGVAVASLAGDDISDHRITQECFGISTEQLAPKERNNADA